MDFGCVYVVGAIIIGDQPALLGTFQRAIRHAIAPDWIMPNGATTLGASHITFPPLANPCLRSTLSNCSLCPTAISHIFFRRSHQRLYHSVKKSAPGSKNIRKSIRAFSVGNSLDGSSRAGQRPVEVVENNLLWF